MSGSSTTTDSEQDSAEDHATSSSESHSSAEEDEDENENGEFMVNIENPDAVVRFISYLLFILRRKDAVKEIMGESYLCLFFSPLDQHIQIISLFFSFDSL